MGPNGGGHGGSPMGPGVNGRAGGHAWAHAPTHAPPWGLHFFCIFMYFLCDFIVSLYEIPKQEKIVINDFTKIKKLKFINL